MTNQGINLTNIKGMSIPTYTEEEMKQLLTKDDLKEFLLSIGYTDQGCND